jgi:putative flavoprotein involved in K+ transport
MPTGDVLVIGAGPAGLNAAYSLDKAGLDYRVVDRASIPASTWNSLYPSLKLNTSRFFSHMPDRKFPLHFGYYPSAKQYHRYLVEWVNERDLNIDYGVDTFRVAKTDDNLWQVETSEGTETYRTVISATGVFNNPQMPQIDGMDLFEGDMMHSKDFKHPDQVKGKRVLVVGNGPSGTDISVAAGAVAISYLSIRSGVDLRPRYPYGFPRHVWMLMGSYLPSKYCEWLQKVTGAVTYNMEDFGLWGIPEGAGTAVGYRGPELLNAVREGQVKPVRHPICFDKRGAKLADGTYLEVDTVIMATGFFPVLHKYLDVELQFSNETYRPAAGCDWDLGPNGLRGWPIRDLSQHPNGRQVLGHEGLYLVGVFYKGRGAFYNMPIEADIATEQITEYLTHKQTRGVTV